MAGIFTRPEIAKILNDESLDADERINRIMSLRGRDLDESYITKSAAKAAQEEAITQAKEAWLKEQPKPNVTESPEYIELQGKFDSYRAKEEARNSADYAEVKPKFFSRVYDLIDRADGAKPVTEQLAALKKDYEEYFNPADPAPAKPMFGAKPEGSMPKGEEGAVTAFSKAWGFVPNK